jgi:hypothetical protein
MIYLLVALRNPPATDDPCKVVIGPIPKGWHRHREYMAGGTADYFDKVPA